MNIQSFHYSHSNSCMHSDVRKYLLNVHFLPRALLGLMIQLRQKHLRNQPLCTTGCVASIEAWGKLRLLQYVAPGWGVEGLLQGLCPWRPKDEKEQTRHRAGGAQVQQAECSAVGFVQLTGAKCGSSLLHLYNPALTSGPSRDRAPDQRQSSTLPKAMAPSSPSCVCLHQSICPWDCELCDSRASTEVSGHLALQVQDARSWVRRTRARGSPLLMVMMPPLCSENP